MIYLFVFTVYYLIKCFFVIVAQLTQLAIDKLRNLIMFGQSESTSPDDFIYSLLLKDLLCLVIFNKLIQSGESDAVHV